MGGSLELGGKWFLCSTNGIFIEGSALLYYSNQPYATVSLLGADIEKVVIGTSAIKEPGFGCSAAFGYDFILNRNLSLEVFTGPILKSAFNLEPKDQMYKEYVNKLSFRWKLGAGLNIKDFNFNVSFSEDVLNRGKRFESSVKKRYRTYSVSIGVAYRFSLSGK